MTTDFALDKTNGKLLGVCAGLARATGWDPLLVRVGAIALTLFAFGPLMLITYVATAFVAESR